MNDFPQTMAALKCVDLEEAGGLCADDDAYWALGDALIEECGVDPVWDVDWTECTFKSGTKIRDAADWLREHGMDKPRPWSEDFVFDLYEFRETSERFPPDACMINISYYNHRLCKDV